MSNVNCKKHKQIIPTYIPKKANDLPMFFENKVFGVFLAEPVSDITAALVTTVVFFTQFKKILEKGPAR